MRNMWITNSDKGIAFLYFSCLDIRIGRYNSSSAHPTHARMLTANASVIRTYVVPALAYGCSLHAPISVLLS